MPLTQADRVKVAVEMGVAQRVEVWLGDTHRQGDRQAVLEWEGQAEAEGEAVEEAEAEEEAVAEVVAVSEVEEVRGDSTSRRRSIRRRAAGGNALSRGLPRRTQGGARGRKEEGVVILGAGTRLAAVRRQKQIPERTFRPSSTYSATYYSLLRHSVVGDRRRYGSDGGRGSVAS